MKKDSKYLGLSIFWGKAKANHFVEIKDRIQSKVSGWKSKVLSQSGRTVLIKSVATSLPQFYMQSLHFPAGWCSKVDKIFKDLWWGHPVHKSRKYTPKAWHAICQPKLAGGLGIRRMKEINGAFLQKLVWLILNNLDLLWVKFLKAKYFPWTFFLLANTKQGASLVWQGVTKVKEDFRTHLCFLPRNGSATSIRQDPWLPHSPSFSPSWLPGCDQTCPHRWVCDLTDMQSGEWDTALLCSIFLEDSVNQILERPPPDRLQLDSLIWTPDPHGKFSFKGAVGLA
ncbi:hypothetical protein CJ030_MR1G005469 [Morella rubra]|uniref:Uncharacterized protein n=1 Tax=Morella rubra TaxID=262757 RepID=A0A6A1WQA2_9ROSI|nr:hypothetical protein CJ030_MR1G005469 [Morella rubra]